MATWEKQKLPRENGELVDMQVPVIVSASRSTDIPAFYADWFFYRLDKAGYSAWTNPFNGVRSYISYKNTRFIVFWSKNPKPLLKYLPVLERKKIGCYIQYSLNDYEAEGLEKSVPPLDERIDTFKQLVERLGKGHVIWRFDPLVLTDQISIDLLLSKIENIGDQLYGYTEKLVFSFADILSYRKVQSNLTKAHVNYIDWYDHEPLMREFAERLAKLNKKWGYELATCGEKIDLTMFRVNKNHCIDDDLIIRLAYNDKVLMDYLKVKIEPVGLFGIEPDAIPLPGNMCATHGDNSDKGQRQFCGCIKSKDIGEYNTCIHGCEYCYANASKERAIDNYKKHQTDKTKEGIT